MNRIDEILQQRRPADASQEAEAEGDKFFSLMLGDGINEHFLELQFSNGLQTCFSYVELIWFNHDPEQGCIDLAFGSFLITIKGRGLAALFAGLKQKRVAWVKEADSQMQDHKGNSTFIEEITITPPKDFTDNPPESEE